MQNVAVVKKNVDDIRKERGWLVQELGKLPEVHKIFPSDANFILVRMDHALAVYKTMAERGVVIRYRGKEIHCQDCVRITVGTQEENAALMKLLRTVLDELSK